MERKPIFYQLNIRLHWFNNGGKHKPIGNQKEAINAMIENQSEKLYNLAKHILENGMNPNDKIQVIRSEANQRKYIVLEGNRRTVCLKILSNPSLIDLSGFEKLRTKFRKLNEKYIDDLVNQVSCVVYENPEEANKWIKIKHAGQNDGVGTVAWNAQQIQRFEAIVEGKESIALQVINNLKKSDSVNVDLKAKLENVPITSLDRLLSDPNVRSYLGVEKSKGKLYSNLEPSEVTKGMVQVVTDLLKPDFNVKKIYTKEDRKKYIGTLPKRSMPDPKKVVAEKWPLEGNGNTPLTPAKPNKRKTEPLSTERKRLIPKKCKIAISNPKVNKIYHELQGIDISRFPNAVAVMFRVFIELSVDCYLEKHNLIGDAVTSARSGKDLRQKILLTIKNMNDKGFTDIAQSKPMQAAAKNKGDILGIDSWHAYVHNHRFSPKYQDLNLLWDGIQDFMTSLWDNVKDN